MLCTSEVKFATLPLGKTSLTKRTSLSRITSLARTGKFSCSQRDKKMLRKIGAFLDFDKIEIISSSFKNAVPYRESEQRRSTLCFFENVNGLV